MARVLFLESKFLVIVFGTENLILVEMITKRLAQPTHHLGMRHNFPSRGFNKIDTQFLCLSTKFLSHLEKSCNARHHSTVHKFQEKN